ncbi:hypothetical protein A2Z33_03890 [Candidatus Gottesmanbacteria bacterium RBG_16_52_11]|uniref:Membrane protein 6-pyruvoyl-tetrahydropterin synthase-related domain-containing protein n=1 Tax=Candidatus Gottesmanbacteria bacterium RBG_16_52_11 TaxID=1798374 RepID=A0A1F5YW08_9BACT|nr:MAG: hypothetical protein A2Z33_03890 [Candidatus Gottesmanbacteria bacterium RBG_16_52_11]
MLPYLFLFVVALVIFHPALNLKPGTYLFGWDTMDQEYFIKSFFGENIRRGVFPWWNPYAMGGYPFASTIDADTFYPPVYLFALLPVTQAISWYYFIHLLLGLAGMYILCRRWFSVIPALLAAVTFMFSGLFTRILAGSFSIVPYAYLPWLMFLFLRSVAANSRRAVLRAAAATGIIGALQVTGSNPITVIYSHLALIFATAVLSVSRRSLRPVLIYISTAALIVGLSAVTTVPMLEGILNSVRSNLTYEWAASGTLRFADLRQMFLPVLWSYRPDMNDYMPFIESPWYIGILPLVLAVSGLFYGVVAVLNSLRHRGKRNTGPAVIIFGILAVFGFWMALGNQAPYDLFGLLWRSVPLFRFIRVPIKIMVLFVFGMAGLAAYATELIRNRIIRTAILFITVIELTIFARQYVIIALVPETRHDQELVATLKSSQGDYRIHPNYVKSYRLGYSWDLNAASTYRFFSTSGNTTSIPANYNDLFYALFPGTDPLFSATMNQMPWVGLDSAGMDILNVRYILVPRETELAEPHYSLVIDNPSRWFRLYRNNRAYPRFRLLSRAAVYPDRAAMRRAIETGNADLSDAVYLTERDAGALGTVADCPSASPGTVSVDDYDISRIRLKADAVCDTYLTTGETMYPGWLAAVDGKRVPMVEGNLALRTLKIPQGVHTVDMWYDPRIYRIGGAVSLVTLIVLVLLNRKLGFKGN